MFITFEGIEGCGKSVQAKALASHLDSAGHAVVLTREPGGTPLGERVREVVLAKDDLAMGPVAETLLFSAARSEHVAEIIVPALRSGKVVVCDRYADSSIAYQAYGRGLDRKAVELVQRFATGGLTPDFTVLLDLDPAEGMRRKAGEQVDRIERMDMGFHRRVREGYLALATEQPSRWLVLDGRLPVEELAAQVREQVEARLSRLAATEAKG